MIGNLLLNMKKFISQMFCMHDYYIVTRRNANKQDFNVYTCKKCGYQKVKKI